MKSFRFWKAFGFCALFAAVVSSLVSCGGKASIDGTLADAPLSEVVVKKLDVNRYVTLDTLKVDSDGKYSCRIDIEKGQPEFVYVFYGDRKVASVLLDRGDRLTVVSDTVGNFTVEGSEESRRFAEVEKDYARFTAEFDSLTNCLLALEPDSEEASLVKKKIGASYIGYYRDRLRYIMENPYSLTVVPVLYQVAGPDRLPVFGQITDAIHFNNVSDSLETVYPDSRYVGALREEAKRRSGLLELKVRLQNAGETGYPDFELADINARKVRLSEVDAKVILLHFWSSSDALQKMFNLDVLKPIYEDYHSRGLEIYQVALDADKAAWASVVKDQNLPWINVCDISGLNAASARLYNISSLPVTFVISGDSLVNEKVSDEKSLRKALDKLL